MAGLDPSIALQTRGVTLPDPLTTGMNALRMQTLSQGLDTNALAYQQAQATAGEQNALRARIAQPDFAGLSPTQQIGEIQRVAPIAGQPIVDKMIANNKSIADTRATTNTVDVGQSKDVAQTIAVSHDPDELVQNILVGVQQKRFDADKVAPVISLLRTGKFDDPAAFKQLKASMIGSVMSPDAVNTAAQPKPTAVETGGGTAFVNTNPQAGPVAPMTGVFPGNPKIVTGAQGEQLSVAPDASSYSAVPFSGAPPAVAAPGTSGPAPGWQGAPPAGRFAGDPAKIAAQIAALPEGPDKAGATQAFNTWRAAGAPQGKTVGGPSASAGGFPTTVPSELIAANVRAPGTHDFNAPEDAKNAGKYEADLNDAVQSGRNLMALNAQFQSALQNYQTGPGASTRLAVAKTLDALGVKASIVEAVNRGSVADAQEIQKLAAQGAMQALKSSMDGQGRISQAEFKVFLANNPNIDLDPNAIQKIQQFQAQQYQRSFAEQQALADFKTKGGNPARWPAVWSATLDQASQAQPAVATDARGTPGSAFGPTPSQKQVVRTGTTRDGRKVVQYADGTTGYAP